MVGTISVTARSDGDEVGNLLFDERYRGRGLMRAALEQVTVDNGRYYALVRPDNEASLRVFSAAGFASLPLTGRVVVD